MENLAKRLRIEPALHVYWDQLDLPTQIATALVYLCYCGHGLDLGKRNLARVWWGDFLPARVALAAMVSSSLAEFSAELARRLQGTIGDRYQGETQRSLWQEIIALPEETQRKVLDVLERQASVCVTLVRGNQDLKKQEAQGGEKTNDSGSGQPGLFDTSSGAAEAADLPAETAVGTASEPAL